MITSQQIDELASRPKVKRVAVENFLSSLDGLSRQDAIGNLEMDAKSYKWARETKASIHEGILLHFKSR